MIVEVLADLALDLRDLLVERGNDFSDRGRDDGRLRRLRVNRLLRPSRLEVLVMAH